MAITFDTLDFSGTVTEQDTRGAQYQIDIENARRAALETPGTPLPFATGAELKASYIEVLLAIVNTAHAGYVERANGALYGDLKTSFQAATDADQDAIRAILGL